MSATEYITILGTILAANAIALAVAIMYYNSFVANTSSSKYTIFQGAILNAYKETLLLGEGSINTVYLPGVASNLSYCNGNLIVYSQYGVSVLYLPNTSFFVSYNPIYYLSLVKFHNKVLISTPGNPFLNVTNKYFSSQNILEISVSSYNYSNLRSIPEIFSVSVSSSNYYSSHQILTPSAVNFTVSPGNYTILINNSNGYFSYCFST